MIVYKGGRNKPDIKSYFCGARRWMTATNYVNVLVEPIGEGCVGGNVRWLLHEEVGASAVL